MAKAKASASGSGKAGGSKPKAKAAPARKPATKDPKGGLTAAGRAEFKRKEGSNLKPGVTKKTLAEMTPEEVKRKGSFLRRHYATLRGPLVGDDGNPTRLALQAHAWGEPVPKTAEAAKKLADKGTKLLEHYQKLKDGDGKGKASGSSPAPAKAKAKPKGSSAAKTKGSTAAKPKAAATAKPKAKAASAKPKAAASTKTKAKASSPDASAKPAAKPRAKAKPKAGSSAKGKKSSGSSEGGPYTDPALRDRLKREIEAGDKGGKPGQWSARKAQLLAAEYKKAGGGYREAGGKAQAGKPKGKAKKTEAQAHLDDWTDQNWTTADGKPAIRDGETARYLPEKAWEEMTPAERKATDRKKREASRGGTQFVANTKAAKSARKKASTS